MRSTMMYKFVQFKATQKPLEKQGTFSEKVPCSEHNNDDLDHHDRHHTQLHNYATSSHTRSFLLCFL